MASEESATDSPPARNNAHIFDDDDEEECRVCRGPAEEGNPLFKPCKCSGSIGLIHQDCLTSWLQVQRGNGGACELCKTQFRFSPKYNEDAPDRLPVAQVLLGLFKQFISKWLPFAIRICFCASLWLFVTPLVTSYLYLGWMNRPSFIMERFTWSLITADLISGAVIAAFIIISFLSLMSFVDFLRMEWGRVHDRRPPRPPLAERPREEDIDEGIWLYVQQEILQSPLRHAQNRVNTDSLSEGEGDDDSETDDEDYTPQAEGEENEDHDNELVQLIDQLANDAGHQIEEPLRNDPPRAAQQLPAANLAARPPPPPPAAREEPPVNRPFDFDDEPVDVDINIALDELLGVRGPISAVFRNLLWLLAFNAVYVGFFCFVPRTVGIAAASLFWNTTRVDIEEKTNATGFVGIWNAIDGESVQQQTVFRLHDLATVTLGYICFATAVWTSRLLWRLSKRAGFLPAQGRRRPRGQRDPVREAIEEMNRVHDRQNDPLDIERDNIAFYAAIDVTFDAVVSMIKVGVLLFLKMFLLPILLGICLDASVASLFGWSLEKRISYAGGDLSSFLLLHWVLGITFMLLVTVSVLQLREVAHPDLLSQVIRPQEPQPDLLGNLMHESVSTHAKRMAISLVIYAVLWAMHIYIPAKALTVLGISPYLDFLKLKFAYILPPQLQVPFELLFFHLCMLGLLERYKNGLGEMQHHWIKLLTGVMGFRDSVLPHEIEGFEYKGSRIIFEEERSIDSFWYDLAKGESDREELLDSQISSFLKKPSQPAFKDGVLKQNGERVLSLGADYIRLPELLPGRVLRSRKILLPTMIGKYRLSRDKSDGPKGVIHLWQEKTGALIPRPPEGWDDLGVEPPDVQGRWAYGYEKKSAIERGVGRRQPFYAKNPSWTHSIFTSIKLATLLLLSWIATTALLFAVLVVPLCTGRALFFLLRISDDWKHDPMAFCLGFILSFPVACKFSQVLVASDRPLWTRLVNWLTRFRFPSLKKATVVLCTLFLWFVVAPLLVGISYDMALVKSPDWFEHEDAFFPDLKSLAMDWATGTMFIYIWSFLCIRGVLTRRFRVFVMEGRELPEDNPGDARAEAWIHTGDGQLYLSWQGEHGRMSLFWDVLNSVFWNWEWDKVDPAILLWDAAVPVTLQLLWTSLVPLSFAILCWYFDYLPSFSRIIAVRLLVGFVSLTQIARLWSDQLLNWFEAAHKAARDDLYLIGEVLMNYGE